MGGWAAKIVKPKKVGQRSAQRRWPQTGQGWERMLWGKCGEKKRKRGIQRKRWSVTKDKTMVVKDVKKIAQKKSRNRGKRNPRRKK